MYTGFFAESGKGLNVTLPHKQAVAALAEVQSEEVCYTNSANTLYLQDGKLTAASTDGAGLIHAFDYCNQDLKAKSILMLGAGGASAAVMPHLLAKNPHSISIRNRNLERAKALKNAILNYKNQSGFGSPTEIFLETGPKEPATPQVYDLVINATSSEWQGILCPIKDDDVHPESFVYDMSYKLQADTILGQWCKAP